MPLEENPHLKAIIKVIEAFNGEVNGIIFTYLAPNPLESNPTLLHKQANLQFIVSIDIPTDGFT